MCLPVVVLHFLLNLCISINRKTKSAIRVYELPWLDKVPVHVRSAVVFRAHQLLQLAPVLCAPFRCRFHFRHQFVSEDLPSHFLSRHTPVCSIQWSCPSELC